MKRYSVTRAFIVLAIVLISTQLAAAPPIRATGVQTSCSIETTSCSNTATLANNNGVAITLDPLTHSFYNATAPGLRYSIYDMNGILVAGPFTCTKQTSKFHSAALADATMYQVQITAPGAASGFYTFTTTKPCKGVKPQDSQRHD